MVCGEDETLTSRLLLASVSQEAKQEQEQVDEVEVKLQRAHHNLAARHGPVLHRAVHFLDALGVPSGHPSKDQDPGRREITKSSPVLLRKILTRIAIINPNMPMTRNDPTGDRSRCVF